MGLRSATPRERLRGCMSGSVASGCERGEGAIADAATMVRVGGECPVDEGPLLGLGKALHRLRSAMLQGDASITANQGSGAPRVIDTPAFNAWFRDSRIVNANGEPLVVYHGTRREFSAFDRAVEVANPWLLGEDHKLGFFFSKSPGRISDSGPWGGAAGFAGTRQVEGETVASAGACVMPVYLAMRAPYHATMAEYAEWGAKPNLREEIEALGFDGIVVGGETYIVFESTQIKSAIGNAGSFDPCDPDIRR